MPWPEITITVSPRTLREQGFQTPWRRLPFLLIEECLTGSWVIEGETVASLTVTAGQCLVVTAGTRHRLQIPAGQQTLTRWTMVDTRWRPGGRMTMPPAVYGVDRKRSRSIHALIEDIHALQSDDPRAVSAHLGRARAAVDLLALLCDEVIGLTAVDARRVDERIATVITMIEDDPTRSWQVAGLARHAGMARSRFYTLFKQAAHCGPMDYVIDQRLRLACQHLIHEDLPIQEIAEASGFSSAFYFSRLFRQRMGTTPSEFRRRYRL